jgi:hypothetical protein
MYAREKPKGQSKMDNPETWGYILLLLTSVFSRQWKTKKNTPCERK